MKKAFTLVELLVVIGILGILSGVLIASFGGGTESARSAQCLSNMKNLASACHTYGMSHSYWPMAGSATRLSAKGNSSTTRGQSKKVYTEEKAWISWNSKGKFKSDGTADSEAQGTVVTCYESNEDARYHALTNSAIFKLVGSNREVFVCPEHKRFIQQNKAGQFPEGPLFSYAMNSYFKWNSTGEAQVSAYGNSVACWFQSGAANSDRRLLFSEISFKSWDGESVFDKSEKCDSVLQYDPSEGGEYIGFNHKAGKNGKCAHIVFADGHVEKISMPRSGFGEDALKKLTQYLCEATDYQINGNSVDKIE